METMAFVDKNMNRWFYVFIFFLLSVGGFGNTLNKFCLEDKKGFISKRKTQKERFCFSHNISFHKVFEVDTFKKKIKVKFPVVVPNDDISKFLDTIVRKKRKCLGLQFYFIKGFTVGEQSNNNEGETKKILDFSEVYSFSDRNSIALNKVEGFMFRKNKIFLFEPSTVDGKHFKFSNDSVELTLKKKDCYFDKYSLTKIENEAFRRSMLHRLFLPIKPIKISEVQLEFDGDNMYISHECFNCYKYIRDLKKKMKEEMKKWEKKRKKSKNEKKEKK